MERRPCSDGKETKLPQRIDNTVWKSNRNVSFIGLRKHGRYVWRRGRLSTSVDSSIQVGVSGPTVWVKVEGKGSFLNSGNLKEFAREMLDRGYREFVVDLADCPMMDSTFMGTLATVALRLRELGQGQLHVVHCGNRCKELLSGLRLDQIFDIRANSASPPEYGALERPSWNQSPRDRKREQTETMLEAHEALCEAAPENILRFKGVLEFLRQDLHQFIPETLRLPPKPLHDNPPVK